MPACNPYCFVIFKENNKKAADFHSRQLHLEFLIYTKAFQAIFLQLFQVLKILKLYFIMAPSAVLRICRNTG